MADADASRCFFFCLSMLPLFSRDAATYADDEPLLSLIFAADAAYAMLPSCFRCRRLLRR